MVPTVTWQLDLVSAELEVVLATIVRSHALNFIVVVENFIQLSMMFSISWTASGPLCGEIGDTAYTVGEVVWISIRRLVQVFL